MRIGNERTSDLALLRKGANYTWGKLVKIHDLGPRYSVVEFHPNPKTPYVEAEEKPVEYTAYVDGKQAAGSLTIEGAILICIGYGSLEPNEARFMAMGAAKLLGIPRD